MRRPALLPWAVLGWTLLATAGATWALHRALETEASARLEDAATTEQLHIEQRMELFTAVLNGVAARFQSGPVDTASFHAYVARLRLRETYPGVQGVGFAAYIPRDDIPRFEQHWRSEYDGFHVWPESTGSHVTSIVLLEPLDVRNRAAIGYDMSTDAARAEAMWRAATEGTARATGKVTLVQEIDSDQQAGFLIYVPVYDAIGVPASVEERWRTLRGFAYAPFRADDLMRARRADRADDISVDVYEGTRLDPAQLLHRDPQSHPGWYVEQRMIDVAGRTWTLVIRMPPGRAPLWQLPTVVALVGMAIAAILFFAARRVVTSERIQRGLRATAEAERQRAERAAEVRERLVAIVSHDLRNPLGAISMGASLLATGPDPAAASKAIGSIQRAAERMTRMIEQLLDFARLRQGTALAITRAPVDLGVVVRSIVDEHRLGNPGREITLQIDGDLHVDVDQDRMAQVLSNLIGNALQHGGGTPVSVSAVGEATRVCVAVHNGGTPIPVDLQGKIFEPFARAADDRSRSLGLGLYISREVVRAHGGELRVSSSSDAGTTFSFSIPRSPSRA